MKVLSIDWDYFINASMEQRIQLFLKDYSDLLELHTIELRKK